jgi:dTDP-glucose 4,6-dehydratase
MTTRVMLTGAGGFVGSHVLRHLLVNTDWDIVCPVTFRHKGQSERIASSLVRGVAAEVPWDRRVDVIKHDLRMPFSPQWIDRVGPIDVILNVASQSHVDRSIEHPAAFIADNVHLMTSMLDYARVIKPKLFLQMSTDEVYGPAPLGHAHAEWETHYPSNPYSASKSAQEAICFAYWRTYGVPLVITNTMNIFGEMQDPEKMFAKVMRCIQRGEPVPIHARRSGGTGYPDGTLIKHWESGSRFYLHARNLADAWLWLVRGVLSGDIIPNAYGTAGAVDDCDRPTKLHIVGEREITNMGLAQMIAVAMGAETWEYEYVDFHSSRPGHDMRYALDGSKIESWGWKAPVSFEEGVRRTVDWTLRHPEWL